MKVLFPIDGTEVSLRAVEKGLGLLAGAPHLRAVALYVTPVTGERFFLAAARELAGADVKPLPAAEALARAKAIASEHRVELEGKEVEGSSEEVLAEAARGYDLLVVHALSRKTAKDLFAGSASEIFVRHAPASVLVVRD